MSEKKIVLGGGLSFTTVLFFIFLILKLTNVVTWSWWWVTCPLWIGPAVFVTVCLVLVLFLAFSVLFKW
jgi:hypothetical protein